VQSIPRYGYIVTPITIKDIEDIYGLRLILETSSVRLAIQRASDEELRRLQDGVDFTYIFKDRETYLEFLQHNIDFHVSIAMASGNRKLAEMLRGVLNDMTQIFNLGLDLRDSALEMRHEHAALANALASRNLENAIEIITDQIQLSRQRVMEEISEYLDQRVVSKAAL
jgi:DNA-binding GntR family transcriptional regulator